MSCADATPTVAPATTSLNQCRLSFRRDHPVPAASVSSPTVAHGRRISLASDVASANAIVVWPEGNESCPENGLKSSASRSVLGRSRPNATFAEVVIAAASTSDDATRSEPWTSPGRCAASPTIANPRGDSAKHFYLTHVADVRSQGVGAGGAMRVEITLERLVQHSDGRDPADRGRTLPPAQRRSCACGILRDEARTHQKRANP